MKIAHVVTYVSPDGAFGGPARVALGQAEALAERGHDVTVYAAAPRNLARTTNQDGYTLKTFPARRLAPVGGFATLAAPRLAREIRRDARTFDVAHIHLARDLVTIPAGLAFRSARTPYVLQPHGMIDASTNPLVKPLDGVATKPLLRGASAVLTLTDQEVEDILGIEASARPFRVSNGVRIGVLPPYEGRPDVVLYLARLHARKRPLAFIQMARVLSESLPQTRFVMAGPDEGEGQAVRDAIAGSGMEDRLEWIGAVSPDRTQDLLTSARAYVLPAVDEVFPMTILEALRAGTPVVTTDSLGIAEACQHFSAAEITDGSVSSLARAVQSVLSDTDRAERLRAGAFAYLRSELNIATIAAGLERQYEDAIGGLSVA